MKRQHFYLMLLSVITLGAVAMSGCSGDDPGTIETKKFTVTFNMNGSTEAGVSPQTVEDGGKATKPADPSRTDYTFKGWFKEAAGTTEWNFATDVVTANVTLYAKWEAVAAPVYYTVMFDSNGGGEVDPQYVLEGNKATAPAQPGKEGFDFKGWFEDDETFADQWDFAVDVVTADLTLYAKWEETPLMDGEPVTILVEAGEFMMGSLGTEPGLSSEILARETPRHKVKLTRDYKIGKFEVTQSQWEALMGDWTPSVDNRGIGDDYPVYEISLNEILGTTGKSVEVDNVKYYENGYIYKLREMTGKPYRLLTEAEWEFAARGGNLSEGYLYSGSNTLADVGWANVWTSHVVGELVANELGIHDMTGNVNEWVSDIWFNYPEEDQVNPISAVSGSNTGEMYNDGNGVPTDPRVHRGGDFGNSGNWNVWHIGFRQRLNYSPGKTPYIGFRVALDVTTEE